MQSEYDGLTDDDIFIAPKPVWPPDMQDMKAATSLIYTLRDPGLCYTTFKARKPCDDSQLQPAC